ncbi:hypothetical protein KFE25_008916 [Diacronema lutheri]|uniref:Prolyl 4-hydroxylase alpha subunit domain-containing protein n=1 Tax=Diacronema lutheri TaxID=2081491 RepID=A0A8J6CHQ6_DIALT|nr:hypothetical protein KFE25_008916 [Diacronema lutheri]
MPDDCRPRICGHAVVDAFASSGEVEALRTIAAAGMAHGGGTGGPTVLDLYSGALSFETQFVSIWHKLNATGAPAIATSAQLATLEKVYRRIRSSVRDAFGSRTCELTSPTFWSRLDASQPPKTPHDEYWHTHVDTAQYGSFAFTALLYLSDYVSDFSGGEFAFVFREGEETVLPARGRLLMFTSASENPHRVKRLRSGQRLTLTVPFTCSAAAAIGPFWLAQARASLRRDQI